MPAVNIAVDPYDLFGVTPLAAGPYTNQRFAQIRKLVREPAKYNTLLMGTSITGIIDPQVIDQLVPGARAYNASFFLATASDLLLVARHLQSQGALPAQVIVGLDPFLFLTRNQDLQYEFMFPPEVEGRSSFTWWADAAFASSFFQAFTKLIDLAQSPRSVVFNRDNGSYSLPKSEANRLQEPKKHAEKVLAAIAAPPPRQTLEPKELEALRALEAVFEKAGTKVVWIYHPSSKVLRDYMGQDRYRAEVATVKAQLHSPVVDLSDQPDMAQDPLTWYDMKHFTAEAGAQVITKAIGSSPEFVRSFRP